MLDTGQANDQDGAAPPVVSVVEAARRLGRSPDAIRGLIRRGRLTAQRGNAGQLLVQIPPGADLSPTGDDDEGTGDDGQAIELLRDELQEARSQIERWRQAAEEARLAAARAEADAGTQRALVGELSAAHQALVTEMKASHQALVDELRAELGWRRRPAWRRLLGH